MNDRHEGREYRVTWEADIWAANAYAAASKARDWLEDPGSLAHVFEVDGVRIDFDEMRDAQ